MSGRYSRNKGQRGEREVISMLQPVIDKVCEDLGIVTFQLKRNLHQRYKQKEYDVDGVPWMALEVKFQEDQSGIGSWWRQVKAACRPGQVPVLIYRQKNRPWMVRTRVGIDAGNGVHVKIVVSMLAADWLVWFEYRFRSDFEKNRS